MRTAHPTFAKNILEPLFELNARLYFHPLIAAHRAGSRCSPSAESFPPTPPRKSCDRWICWKKKALTASGPLIPPSSFTTSTWRRALVERSPGGEAAVGNLNLGRTRPEPLAHIVMREATLQSRFAPADPQNAHPPREMKLKPSCRDTHICSTPSRRRWATTSLPFAIISSATRSVFLPPTRPPINARSAAAHVRHEPAGGSQSRRGIARVLKALREHHRFRLASDHVTESAAAFTNLMTIVGRLVRTCTSGRARNSRSSM